MGTAWHVILHTLSNFGRQTSIAGLNNACLARSKIRLEKFKSTNQLKIRSRAGRAPKTRQLAHPVACLHLTLAHPVFHPINLINLNLVNKAATWKPENLGTCTPQKCTSVHVPAQIKYQINNLINQ